MTASLSARIAEFALDLRFEDIPGEVIDKAKLHMLDAIGCGLAASALAIGTAGRAIAGTSIDGMGATIIGAREPAPLSDAALANGMLCHALDFDDTHGGSICHVSAVAVPALIAAAEANGSSGKDLLAALVAANEIIARIGIAASPEYMVGGFHPTSVCGIFGAAAGSARLSRLTSSETRAALGVAGSMAGGLFAYLADGSSTKPIHAGWAAGSGLKAMMLAAAGAEGPATVFEDRFGFFASYYGEGADTLSSQVTSFHAEWETNEISLKAYPSCHFIHGCLDAAASLLLTNGQPAPHEITSICVSVPEPGIPLVLDPRDAKISPRTAYDAKFSLPYSIGSLLVNGRIDLSSYFADALHDPEALALAALVRNEQRPFPTYPRAFPGWVRIELRNGDHLECEVPYQAGSPENPLRRDEVMGKFRANAKLALADDTMQELEDLVLTLEDVEDLRGCLQRVLGGATAEAAV